MNDRYRIYDFSEPAPRKALYKAGDLVQANAELRRLGRGEVIDFWRLPRNIPVA